MSPCPIEIDAVLAILWFSGYHPADAFQDWLSIICEEDEACERMETASEADGWCDAETVLADSDNVGNIDFHVYESFALRQSYGNFLQLSAKKGMH